LLAGWALDHQAGLALKGVKHVALAGTKLSEGSDHSSRPATDDDHRHEWYGRIWGGRLGESIGPIVARRWLLRLVRANSGIFELELMLHTVTALEACDYGEITPMLMATKKGRKVNWTMLRLQQRAISFVEGLVGHGMKKESALEQVANAYLVGANSVRSWERRLDVEFGHEALADSRKIRKRGGVRDSDSKDGPASIWLARLEQNLLESGRQYIAETKKKRAKGASDRKSVV
jgi:hypothetical protein